MTNTRTLRTIVSSIFIFLLIGLDITAAIDNFPSLWQVTLLITLLTVTTLLAVIFHLRCRECEGCMKKYRQGLNTFYIAFAGIGFLSTFYIMLPEIIVNETIGKLVLTLAYTVVIGLGSPLAFRSLTGIEASTKPSEVIASPSANDEVIPVPSQPLKTETYETLVEANLLPEKDDLVEDGAIVTPIKSLTKTAQTEQKAMDNLQVQKQIMRKEAKRGQYESLELQQAARDRQRALEKRRKHQRAEAKL